jgi:hypothetical protein
VSLTVEYTMTRAQFGRVIGSFQVLQHRLADLHVLVESALSLSRAHAAGDAPALGLRASAVKVYCSEALMRTAAEMIPWHGAIGIPGTPLPQTGARRAAAVRLSGCPAARLSGCPAVRLSGRPAQHAAVIAASLIGR